MMRILIIAMLAGSFSSVAQEQLGLKYNYSDSPRSDYFTNHGINIHSSRNSSCGSVAFPTIFHDLSDNYSYANDMKFSTVYISKLINDERVLFYNILVNERTVFGRHTIVRGRNEAEFCLTDEENVSFNLIIAYSHGFGSEDFFVTVTDILNFSEN